MRTVRCSGRRGGRGRWCLPRESARGVSAQGGVYPSMHWVGGVCIPACTGWEVCPSACWDTHSPVVNRIIDTRLWKHYLSATTLRTVNMSVSQKHLKYRLIKLTFTCSFYFVRHFKMHDVRQSGNNVTHSKFSKWVGAEKIVCWLWVIVEQST